MERLDVICEATDAALVEENLSEFLERLYSLYTRAGFNEGAKLGFLRIAVTKSSALATFSTSREVRAYAQLYLAVKDYVRGTSVFHATTASTEVDALVPGRNNLKEVKLLVRQDARVVRVEAKIDILAD